MALAEHSAQEARSRASELEARAVSAEKARDEACANALVEVAEMRERLHAASAEAGETQASLEQEVAGLRLTLEQERELALTAKADYERDLKVLRLSLQKATGFKPTTAASKKGASAALGPGLRSPPQHVSPVTQRALDTRLAEPKSRVSPPD